MSSFRGDDRACRWLSLERGVVAGTGWRERRKASNRRGVRGQGRYRILREGISAGGAGEREWRGGVRRPDKARGLWPDVPRLAAKLLRMLSMARK